MSDDATENVPNYREQGGALWVIGGPQGAGELRIGPNGTITDDGVQAAAITPGATAVVTTAPTQTTPWGFSTSAQPAAMITAINQLITNQNAIIAALIGIGAVA